MAGSAMGWVNAACLQEIGRPGFAGQVPSRVRPLFIKRIAKCDDADIIMKVVKLSVGFAGGWGTRIWQSATRTIP